jgi:protein arginine kinase activator
MMLCQICKANPATIHIQEIVNGETNTLHICAECARKRNLAEGNTANSHFHEMLERLTQAIANSADLKLAELFEPKKTQEEEEAEDLACTVCGTTFQSYRKTGMLGCASCYTQFGQLLLPELALIHHGSVHCGKTPPETMEQWQDPAVSERINKRRELEELRKGLDESVRREEFELAAELRDRIASIEAGLKTAEFIPDESAPVSPPKKPRGRGRRKSE